MKDRTILLLAGFLFMVSYSLAGTKLDFRTVDMLTYRYYEEKKWDSVIVIGKQALREDIDYYYLRARMGVAYFEKKEYFPSTVHLRKARQFNSGDPLIADYLYKAYVYTNRMEEARALKATIPAEDRRTPDSGTGFLEQVHFESGYTFSSNTSPKTLSTLTGKDSIYGEQDLYGNSLYENLGVKLMLSNRVSLSLAYNYLNFTKTKYIQYNNFSFPWVIHDTSFRYQVSQHEVHLGATISLPAGYMIMPAIHWIRDSYPVISPKFSMDTVFDTGSYITETQAYTTFPFARTNYTFISKDTAYSNWVVSLAATKDLGIFNLGIAGSWSNLNNMTQIQAGLMLTYYPLGNLNFYGTTTATGFSQEKKYRLLLSQVLGVKATRWLWLEGDFYYGDYTNANIFNGSVVYNNSDVIDYRGGATMVFVVGKHIQLSLIYQYFRKESQQVYYIRKKDPGTGNIKEIPQVKNNPYNTNTIIGGITWKL
jgi:hypothetical protein